MDKYAISFRFVTKNKKKIVKEISFLSLLFLLFTSMCSLIFGCNPDKKEIESFEPDPCIRKYPADDYGNWKAICEQAPFVTGQPISQSLIFALQEVGFLCSGHLFPAAEEINLICEDQYMKLNK